MIEQNNFNFDFEIDNSVYLNYKEALKIFGHDEMTIKKITKYPLIIGGILFLSFVTHNLFELFLFFFNQNSFDKPSVLNYLGLAMFLSAIYIRKNFKKNPMIIVYTDKIIFKKKRTYTNLPLLKILDFYDLYRMGNYITLLKSEIKCIVNCENDLLDNAPNFELKTNSLKYSILLNVNKDYQKHIYMYLSNYLGSDNE